MDDGLKTLLRGKKKKVKPIFCNSLFGWFSAWGCFPGRELDTGLRELGKTEDATLVDRDKNTP